MTNTTWEVIGSLLAFLALALLVTSLIVTALRERRRAEAPTSTITVTNWDTTRTHVTVDDLVYRVTRVEGTGPYTLTIVEEDWSR